MALVVTMLVLLFISLIATAMIVSTSIESRLAGRTGREDEALNTAEAGIAEAMERIRQGDVPDNGNPKMVSQIFLDAPGSVPVLSGTDSVALPTLQDGTNWLTYSTPGKGPDVLTVAYKTDANQTKIYRYDPNKNPAVQTATGPRIFVITSTGRNAEAKRTLVTEVIQGDVKTFCKAAVTAGRHVHVINDSYLCGYNHTVDAPTWIDNPNGRNGSSGACNDNPGIQHWELGTGDLPGAWACGVVSPAKGKQYGVPSAALAGQSGFYTGCWDVLGMTQQQFLSLVGAPVRNPAPLGGTIDGVRYYVAGTTQIKNGQGTGLLYVDGDLECEGDFIYRGLVYATGTIRFNGRVWVLGAVVAGQDVFFKVLQKQSVVLYSHDAIASAIDEFAGPFITLSWREKP